jgi:hypothetical protein
MMSNNLKEYFTISSAKLYINRNVSLHLKDGVAIVSVQLKTIKTLT